MASWVSRKFPLFPTILVGIAAFGVTFLLVREFISYGGTVATAVAVEQWQLDAWYTLGAHHVELTESASTGQGQSGIVARTNLIEASGGRFQFLYLLPPIVLFVAGLILASHARGAQTGRHCFQAGAAVAFGYILPVLAVAMLSAVTESGFGLSARLGPALLPSIFLAGAAYPIIFGGAGGLANYVAQRL